MKQWRYGLASAGITLGLFGIFRLVTQIPFDDLTILSAWLIGAVIIHDGVLSPLVLAVGWLVARIVPQRARPYLQAALVTAALVTAIAVPLIVREGSQPPSKALLRQNYGANLTVLFAIIAAFALACYAVRVASDNRRRSGK
jgi:hypothetical protein